MPDKDAFEVLAEAFRVIECMVTDFVTRHCQGQPDLCPHAALDAWQSPIDDEKLDEIRTLRASAQDLDDPGRIKMLELSKAEMPPPDVLRERYADVPEMAAPEDRDDPLELAKSVMPVACALLEKDGFHQSIFWFRHRGGGWRLIQVEFENRSDKYRVMHELATMVRGEDYDAFVFVGEIWVLPREIEAEFPFIPPTRVVDQLPGKSESLLVVAASEDGVMKTWEIPFTREGARTVCPCAPLETSGEAPMFDPIRSVWGIPPVE